MQDSETQAHEVGIHLMDNRELLEIFEIQNETKQIMKIEKDMPWAHRRVIKCLYVIK